MMIKSAYSYFLTCFLLLGWQLASAQLGVSDRIDKETDRAPSIAAMLKAADKAFSEGDYYTAMQYNYRIVQIDTLNEAALDGFGKSAVALSAFERADTAYRLMDERKFKGLDGLALLHWADVQFRLGQFENAKGTYNRFLAAPPAGTPQSAIEKAKENLKNADWAADIIYNEKSDLEAKYVDDANTVEWSEFSPLQWHDKLYYSSYSFPFKKDKQFPKRHLIKIMEGTQEGDSLLVKPTDFNEEDKHTAHITFNQAGDVMYYTICEYVATANIRCDLYMRKSTGIDTWGPAIKLPDNINNEEYSTTEPNVGHTPNNDREVLYFVSDRPDGLGKKDIWYSQILRDSFSAPVNLAAVNTKEDDVTPFYHTPSSTLYFSTTGRRTLGGFDIYSSKVVNNQWNEPSHAGLPYNSIANDVYYTMDDAEETIYFASNKRGSYNESEEACCYDLYRVGIIRPAITVDVHTKCLEEPVYGTKIRLTETTGNKNGPEQVQEVVAGSLVHFEMKLGKSYLLTATKEGYEPYSRKLENVSSSDTVRIDLLPAPVKLKLAVTVFDRDSTITSDPLYDITTILIDLGPSENSLKGQGTARTYTYTDNKTHEYDLLANHRYKVVVSLNCYDSDSSEINTLCLTTPQTLTKKFYLNHTLTNLNCYLPIKLYYDNDEPDKRTLATTTKQEYRLTYVNYIRRKQEFIKIFTEGMVGDELQQERDSMDVFFERDIRGGWNKLMSFSEILYDMMSRGDKIELTLKGYASPRAGSAYNLNLTSRRVSSVLNHFLIFDGGIYKKFVQSGQLVIKLEPNGEAKAPPGINDNVNDVRRSWYSVPASRERRLEIIGVQINANKKI